MDIPIYHQEPSDWSDLQNKVARIFNDMGYITEVEKDIELVRGSVTVDVFASKQNLTSKEIHIAECKYWTSAVPKAVVHSVRTIVADFGANVGYIISRNGFQKGAYEAITNSNILLMTFNEFQSEFRERWLDCVVHKLDSIAYPVRRYCDPLESFYKTEFDLLSDDQRDEFYRLGQKYNKISMKSTRMNYRDMLTGKLELDYLDKVIADIATSLSIQANCLMEYFEYLTATCEKGLNEFDTLFGKKLRKW